MAQNQKSKWKTAAIIVATLGIWYGSYKVVQFITEKTRANRVQINFVR